MTLDTRTEILNEAEFLIRTRGYSAFSYADLADRVAITKASVHYYFPTKEDLIVVLVREYVERFLSSLADIKRIYERPSERLRAYAQGFVEGFDKGMLPLCAALSAERSALPEVMGQSIKYFFQIHLDWLTEVLEEGAADHALRENISPAQTALLLLSSLEGGSLVGWALERNASVMEAFEEVMRTIEKGALVQPERRAARRSD
ncbi:TetR/AcrR family transcriptional regulator [Rhodoblastus acidophilus]|uniref:TetR/AcrR family transcriptional regulator n=1 Tax=Candidatus Rhodoblastus alkanivorans TaxID=2954117 RepID=A0ABS9ZC06_9HYPH|nr:TetR/AcrR family transcriptional regulator [Candidatus Rhodoblastus alkanivorans]MCI4679117.1 TetR/AcrR family transcriptional regulator [Candidatus Rhodoblastus alkanivorans]MCI4684995.1 TetR/AcrR family transcriptional regulator [Candidatus Rhodoblastus alkanivorans]MDI4643096.1 TetR/AcrR family transcriptional regulator [Rhodoblastus acidophilus]